MQLSSGRSYFAQVCKDNDSYLLIERKVVNTLLEYQQNDPLKQESGGVLVGFYRGKHIHITDLSTPQAGDDQSKHSFIRKDIKHTNFIEKFMNHNVNGSYIGEWHTHPQDRAHPSSVDRSEWNKVKELRNPAKTCFIIVGNNFSYFEIL